MKTTLSYTKNTHGACNIETSTNRRTLTHAHINVPLCMCVCGRDRDRAGETGDKGGLVVARAVAVVGRTYPLSSNMEPRRTLRRWLAVTGNGPVCPSGPTRPCRVPPPRLAEDIDWERMSRRGLCMDDDGAVLLVPLQPAVGGGTHMVGSIATSTAPPLLLLPMPRLPAFELELSRRNRPMTDLGCLGLFIPPSCWGTWAW